MIIHPHARAFISLSLTLVMPFYHTLAFAHGDTPPSLQGVPVPTSTGLLDGDQPIVTNQSAAIQLGKALFWDSAVGSDGMACASCHFHAGADARFINQLATGRLHNRAASGTTFESTASGGVGGVNYPLKRSDFPFYQLQDPSNRRSTVLFHSDDVVGSAGVATAQFTRLNSTRSTQDNCTVKLDAIFHSGRLTSRQVTNRQAPSVINAAYNFRNFWDGHANNIFNGVSPFGARDSKAAVWVLQTDGSVTAEKLRLENAALASQAVAPPLNDIEMSCAQRTFPEVARKLLTRQPLADQAVHAEDSVLATLRQPTGDGLQTTYQALIKRAFAPRFWAGKGSVGQPAYSQIEANFSLFFGLALQLYQQTLISDQTAFDTPRIANSYPKMPSGLNSKQQRGLRLFLDAHCAVCHRGPTLSAAAHPQVFAPDNKFSSLALVNRKTMNGAFSQKGIVNGLLDEGFFNTSVTPTDNDMGLGGKDPFGNPLSFSEQYLQQLLTGKPLVDPVVINSCDLDNSFAQDYLSSELLNDPYITGACGTRSVYAKIPSPSVLQAELQKLQQGRALVAVRGAFKVPSLRNVELTAPYMHNGSLLTLEQVIDFYFRGGNFNNPHHFATLVFPQGISDAQKSDLVAFLKSLTDERVRWERAPFDHPALRIPHGIKAVADNNQPQQAADKFLTIPAVGKKGRDVQTGPLKAVQNYLKP
jgi:cytochrome c peroxidase